MIVGVSIWHKMTGRRFDHYPEITEYVQAAVISNPTQSSTIDPSSDNILMTMLYITLIVISYNKWAINVKTSVKI